MLAIGLCLGVLGACHLATRPPAPDERPGTLTVMTRSLAPATSLERVWSATGAAEVAPRVAEWWGALRQEDLVARSRALADEIQYARPHLLGLQQVAQVRLQSPGDAIFGGGEPAQALQLDLLPALLAELDARGLRYREVARVRDLDVEVPLLTGAAPSFDDARLTDFDVILAREDVAVSGVRTGNYVARRDVEVPGLGRLALPRGWLSLVAEVGGQRYRFVSTHLEAAPGEEGLRVQLAQAAELIHTLRGEPLPVVLVGDFNSPANLGLVGAPTYRELLLAGYVDVWTRRPGGALAFSPLETRRNLVLVRGSAASGPPRVGPVLAYGVGDARPERRLAPWRSNLGGVVAHLRLPPPRN
ncbi:endonuclease/exonuclease/phosphatase family protein [Archangium primigenium]|uniref:endonuclease/exonuclease/phosphatase family protein n=1 Tax=[Archangium] primigenium TaxID=2792470 RepID=UPI00195B6D5E|nr:endonuclease/exonuclease/phosphatase family protein [Archangium primigenium]MBM7116072.1 hypothetical protein [Archangium primigenium]